MVANEQFTSNNLQLMAIECWKIGQQMKDDFLIPRQMCFRVLEVLISVCSAWPSLMAEDFFFPAPNVLNMNLELQHGPTYCSFEFPSFNNLWLTVHVSQANCMCNEAQKG